MSKMSQKCNFIKYMEKYQPSSFLFIKNLLISKLSWKSGAFVQAQESYFIVIAFLEKKISEETNHLI